MIKQSHPSATILADIAAEAAVNPFPAQEFEWTHESLYETSLTKWHPAVFLDLLLARAVNSDYTVRRRPRTIEIAGVELPEPMREAPEYGSRIWVVTAASPTPFLPLEWNDSKNERRLLELGFVQATKQGARQHARALIIASGGNPDA